MRRARIYLGILAGVIVVGSAAAHSVLGWRELGTALAATNAPATLAINLMFGWQFAGVSMLTLGSIVLWTFFRRLRGRPVSMWPAMMIGVVYAVFGAWAMLVSGNGFFLIFVIPGLLLRLASWESSSDPVA
jgi:hypothetical protein